MTPRIYNLKSMCPAVWLLLLVAAATATSAYLLDPWSEPMSAPVCVLIHACAWGAAIVMWLRYRSRLRCWSPVLMFGFFTLRVGVVLVVIGTVGFVRELYFRCPPTAMARLYAALESAVHRNDLKTVQAILACDPNPDYVPPFDESRQLEYAAPARPLVSAVEDGRFAITVALLDHGAAIDGTDRARLLVSAAARGDVDMLRLLVDRGARVNESATQSPALWAAVENERYDAAAFLLARGADPNADVPDDSGAPADQASADTVLHQARLASNDRIAKLLIQYGARK